MARPGVSATYAPAGGGSEAFLGSQATDESSFDITQYWRLLLKHRILMAAIFVSAVVIGVIVTLLATPLYTASTTVQIDREAARVLNTEDETSAESMIQGEEFFQTQYGLLRSRTLSQRVVESLGLASSDTFLEQMGVDLPDSEGASRTAEREQLVLKTVQDNLGVQPVRGSRLVSVTFSSPNPALSARVANAFAENFIQSNLDRRFESSRYARDFLEDRLAQTKARLEDTERQLVAYASGQQLINVAEPGEGESSGGGGQSLAANDLVALNEALATARARRTAAEAKWRGASSGAVMNLPEVLSNPTIQRLTEQRAVLNASYQQKSSLYQADFPEMQQLRAQINEIDQQIAELAGDIRTSIRRQYDTALSEERGLQQRVNGLKADVLDFRNRSIQYNILAREVDTNRTLYDALLQRYKEIGVAATLTANNISIVDPAEPPRSPSSPNLLLNLALAALSGLGLGVLAAFVLEALDETLVTPDDVETKIQVPVLGVVPMLPKGVDAMSALQDVRSAFSEAYYSLRTALQFSTAEGAPSALLVTSSRPGEGKSTTALAIAENFARVGRRVLLLDLDLRNPSMHRLLGADNEHGMSEVLSGAADLDAALQSHTSKSLAFIPSGPLPPNPAELLSGSRIQAFLDQARERYDIIIIDGPPVLGLADAPVLAATVGTTVFVIEAKATRRGQARGAMRRLRMGHSKILGVVLTKFDAKTSNYGGYDYSYDYNYGPSPANTEPGKR